MFLRPSPWPRLMAFLLAAACGLAMAQPTAQPKPRIEKAADLPRFSYAITGKVEDVIRSPEKFAPFAAALRKNTESVLNGYDIPDAATRSNLLGTLATLDFLDGRYDAVAARVAEWRRIQDKPADKLLIGLRLQVMAEAAKANGPAGEAYRRDVAAGVRRALEPLPYPVVANSIREAKEGMEVIGEALILGRAREVVQPIVDRDGAISSDFAPALAQARFALLYLLPLKQTLADEFKTYLDAHQVAKLDIWAARDVTLTAAQAKTPVVIGVWDSGVDTSLYGPQLLRDAAGKPAVIAYDKYSRPASGALEPLPASMQGRLGEMMGRIKGFSDLQSNIDSPEAAAIKAYLSGLSAERYKPAIEELTLSSQFAHGTHVAGIALAGNPAARLVIGRIEFDAGLVPDPCPSEEQVARDSKAAQATVDFFKAKKVRIVNMSWGGTLGDIESALEQCGIGKTVEERKPIARHYFDVYKQALTKAFASAPQILFVTAAGNSNNDASFTESIPSGIVLPNLLTVGAVDAAGDEASFTSYGPTVKVHADGYQVESYLPGGSRVALSGTSMASPEVTNLAGKLLAVKPSLTPTDLVRLITVTADRSEDGRRVLMNPKKALAAAMAG